MWRPVATPYAGGGRILRGDFGLAVTAHVERRLDEGGKPRRGGLCVTVVGPTNPAKPRRGDPCMAVPKQQVTPTEFGKIVWMRFVYRQATPNGVCMGLARRHSNRGLLPRSKGTQAQRVGNLILQPEQIGMHLLRRGVGR